MSFMIRLLAFKVLFVGGMAVGAADERLMDVVSATYKITNPGSTATAFVVSWQPNTERKLVLITAAHVLESMSGDHCKLIAREQRLDGTWVRREITVAVRHDGQSLWVRHPHADVAAMQLSLPATNPIAAIRYEQISDQHDDTVKALAMGDPVWILGYPAQLESSRVGFPVLRHGTIASFPLEATPRTRTFMVDFMTSVGDSGGPVFTRQVSGDASRIVGLIHGQHRETTKSTTTHEERTTHRSMGLAIVTHGRFIGETIQRLPVAASPSDTEQTSK